MQSFSNILAVGRVWEACEKIISMSKWSKLGIPLLELCTRSQWAARHISFSALKRALLGLINCVFTFVLKCSHFGVWRCFFITQCFGVFFLPELTIYIVFHLCVWKININHTNCRFEIEYRQGTGTGGRYPRDRYRYRPELGYRDIPNIYITQLKFFTKNVHVYTYEKIRNVK